MKRLKQTGGRSRFWRRCAMALSTVAVLSIVAPGTAETASGADRAEWKVGIARADITPQEPIWMAGYASRDKPSQDVLAPLFANALALQDPQGNRGVIITADVIGFRADVAAAACQAIMEKTELAREQILLNWSHTHTGPVIGFAESAGYALDEKQQQVVDSYTRKLIEQYAELAAAALNDLRPARLSWNLGVATFPMNRREFTDTAVRIGVNPRGYVDRSVLVLRVDDTEGQPRAVLYGCACHNTTLTGQHFAISGDYAGFARAHIEEELPGVQAMFLIGCGGDINPHPRGEVEHAKQHGRALGSEVCRVLEGSLRPISARLTPVLEQVALPLRECDRDELERMANGPSYLAHNAKTMLNTLVRGESLPVEYTAPIAVWQFGDELTLVALPGEVVSDYAPLIEEAIGHTRLWVAGYSNDVFGYLPSAKVLREGGYETRGLIGIASGFFSPEAESVTVDAVKRLAERAGRPDVP